MTVLGVDEATVTAWVELRAHSEAQGMTKQVADLWIAATARRHDLPLLTTDRGFLTALGIQIITPGVVRTGEHGDQPDRLR